ncbi:MAG: transcription antitermination factor NusB [Treponema sp.]|nr:transcription antitermination factor NusB [Treponema sp.]
MSRRKARILAFQALYSYDVGGESLDELLALKWTEEKNDQEEVDFARLVISGTINHLAEIDSLIKGHLTGKWEFDRVNKVSIAILRISVFALLYQKDTSASIIIDEAIGLSKEFGTDDSFKFINAVLDHIRREIESE